MNKRTLILKNKLLFRFNEYLIEINSKNYPPILAMALCAGVAAQYAVYFRTAIHDKNFIKTK